jgi:hypothetical protein
MQHFRRDLAEQRWLSLQALGSPSLIKQLVEGLCCSDLANLNRIPSAAISTAAALPLHCRCASPIAASTVCFKNHFLMSDLRQQQQQHARSSMQEAARCSDDHFVELRADTGLVERAANLTAVNASKPHVTSMSSAVCSNAARDDVLNVTERSEHEWPLCTVVIATNEASCQAVLTFS